MFLGQKSAWLFVLFVPLGGCKTVSLNAGFDEVSALVEERGARKIFWNGGTELDKETLEQVRSLVKGKFTVDEAVQVALLKNRGLQAIYSELGVAQADLVQAGLLRNPIFHTAVLFLQK